MGIDQPPQRLQVASRTHYLRALQLEVIEHRDGEFILCHQYAQPLQPSVLLPTSSTPYAPRCTRPACDRNAVRMRDPACKNA